MNTLKVRWQSRYWRWFASFLLCVILALASFATWLLHSPSGAHWTLNQVNRYLSSTLALSLSFKQVQGSLWHGLHIDAIELQHHTGQLGFNRISAESLTFSWQLNALINKELYLEAIELGNTNVYLSANTQAKETESSFFLPRLNLPVEINIAQFKSGMLALYPAAEKTKKAAHTAPKNSASRPTFIQPITTHIHLRHSQMSLRQLRTIVAGKNLHLSEADLWLEENMRYRILANYFAEIDVSGECEYLGDIQCKHQVLWHRFKHAYIEPLSIPEGTLHIQHLGNTLNIEAKSQLVDGTDSYPLQFKSTADLSNLAVELTQLKLIIDEGYVALTGRAQHDRENNSGSSGDDRHSTMNAEFKLDIHQVDSSRWSNKTGILNAENTLSLTINDGQWHIDIAPTLHQLELHALTNMDPATSLGKLSLSGKSHIQASGKGKQLNQINVAHFHAYAGEDSVRASAQWDRHSARPKMAVDISIQQINQYVQHKAIQLDGAVKLGVELTGFDEHLQLDSHAKLSHFSALQYKAEQLSWQANAQLPSVNHIRQAMATQQTRDMPFWLALLNKRLNINALDIYADKVVGVSSNKSIADNTLPDTSPIVEKAQLHLSGTSDALTLRMQLTDGFGLINSGRSEIHGQLDMPNQTLASSTNAAPATLNLSLKQLDLAFNKALEVKTLTVTKSPKIKLSAQGLSSKTTCVDLTLKSLGQNTSSICIDDLLVKPNGEFQLAVRKQALPLAHWLNHSLFQSGEQTLNANTDTNTNANADGQASNWHMDASTLLTASVNGQWQQTNSRFNRLRVQAILNSKDASLKKQHRNDQLASDDAPQYYTLSKFHFALNGDENALTLTGALALDDHTALALTTTVTEWQNHSRRTTASFNGDLRNLQLFNAFLPSVDALSGSASFDIRYTHPPIDDKGRIFGHVNAQDLAFNLPATGTQLKHWDINLTGNNNSLTLDANGDVGAGPASINGKLFLLEEDKQSQLHTALTINGNALNIIALPDAQLNASPQLKLSGTNLSWHVDGHVGIDNSFLILNDIPESANKVSTDTRLYGLEYDTAKPATRLSANIQLIAGDNITFSGFGLTTDIAGRLDFSRDKRGSSEMHGLLTLPEGKFKGLGQELDIENGQIIFSGPIDNPALNVEAGRKIDNIVAGLRLEGNARNLTSSLYSSPPMAEADILSYLLTGKSATDVAGGQTNNLEATALTLGLQQALPTLQKIGGQFGISDISIDSGPAGGSGSISAGARLSNKLYVKYRYGLVGALGQFVIEYALTERLKLEAGSGESSSVDVTYTWNSNPPPNQKDNEGKQLQDENKH